MNITVVFLEAKVEKETISSALEDIGIRKYSFVVEELPDCYNILRDQYDAYCLLKYILSKYPPIVLAITQRDIYVEGLNFVFGLAIPFKGCIVSFYRLRTEDAELYRSRIRKEIKHELGHVFGLSHCTPPCVMSFSNSVYEVDLKSENFCSRCKKKLMLSLRKLDDYHHKS